MNMFAKLRNAISDARVPRAAQERADEDQPRSAREVAATAGLMSAEQNSRAADDDPLAHLKNSSTTPIVWSQATADLQEYVLRRVADVHGEDFALNTDPEALSAIERALDIAACDYAAEEHSREHDEGVSYWRDRLDLDTARRIADGSEEREQHDDNHFIDSNSCGGCIAADRMSELESHENSWRAEAAHQILADHERTNAQGRSEDADTSDSEKLGTSSRGHNHRMSLGHGRSSLDESSDDDSDGYY